MPLTPRIHPRVQQAIQEKNIKKLITSHGTPLNILFPENFKENIVSFQKSIENAQIKGAIYYAHKSNKSIEFVQAAKEMGIRIDVASYNELLDALKGGFVGKDIEATGPKSEEFLQACIEHDVLVNVDSFCELDRLVKHFQGKKIHILIRLSGFTILSKSRFGIHITQKEQIVAYLKAHAAYFNCMGLSFHSDGDLAKKKSILVEIIEVIQFFLSKGIRIRILDIGGGFMISYGENKTDFTDYIEKIRHGLIGTGEEMTWNANPYGFEIREHSIIGSGTINVPYKEVCGASFLTALLEYEHATWGNISLAAYLRENLITLMIEPGRALHDNTGIRVARVISTKKMGDDILIILDINIFTIGEMEKNIFIDPCVLSYGEKKVVSEKGVYFVGNLCLEQDFLFDRKCFLGEIPQVGDAVIFFNSGGYIDFYENTALLQKTPKSIFIS